jgi:hypothetical protein
VEQHLDATSNPLNEPDFAGGLADAVINEGSHYEARVANHAKMKPGAYRGYLRNLVWNQARYERLYFQRRHSDEAIDRATDIVLDHMNAHMKEML